MCNVAVWAQTTSAKLRCSKFNAKGDIVFYIIADWPPLYSKYVRWKGFRWQKVWECMQIRNNENLCILMSLKDKSLSIIHNCHESGLWTSVNSPPEVTRSPHGLLHYTNVLHATSDYNSHHPLHWGHTSDCTDHTPYINHGLPLPLCRVLYSDSYSTEPTQSCLASFLVFDTCPCFLD